MRTLYSVPRCCLPTTPPPLDYDIHDLRYIPVYIFFACQDFLMSLPPSPLTYFHKRCDVPVFVTTTPLGVFKNLDGKYIYCHIFHLWIWKLCDSVLLKFKIATVVWTVFWSRRENYWTIHVYSAKQRSVYWGILVVHWLFIGSPMSSRNKPRAFNIKNISRWNCHYRSAVVHYLHWKGFKKNF